MALGTDKAFDLAPGLTGTANVLVDTDMAMPGEGVKLRVSLGRPIALAPDIQEEILFLPLVTTGRDPIHEKLLRPVTAETRWQKQRTMWVKLRVERGACGSASAAGVREYPAAAGGGDS